MKKLFLFAAGLLMAGAMNAEVYNLNIVDTTSTDAAKTSVENAFTLANATVAGKADNSGKPYAEVSQTEATTDWETTSMELVANSNLKFAFKDGNANKLVLKCYASYMQPNGGAVKLIVDGLKAGDKINIVLKSEMKAVKLEGVDEAATAHDLVAGDNILTMVGTTFAMYSKNDAGTTTKWQICGIKTGADATGSALNDVEVSAKARKIVENGQIILIKNGVRYNLLGAKL